jgi:hypothetical protein
MEHNVGKWDKAVRLGVGASLFIMGLPMANANVPSWTKIVFLVLGVILVVTGVTGFCPIYKMLKMSTNKVSDADVKDLLK